MRYVFFTNTPAHVHLYKHAVRALEAEGHDVLVLGRDYGCTEALLAYYDLPYEIYGKVETTKYSLARELPKHYASILRKVRAFDPDLIFGMGGYAAHAGALTRTPVVLILDSEPTSLDHLVSRPFADLIMTPYTFGKDLGPKHYRFAGFKETAYLHPDVFEPAPDVREQLGVAPDEPFALVRFNAFGSHHDVGHRGFSPAQRVELIERLAEHVTVFVTDEGDDLDLTDLPARPYDVHPALLHDVLAEARVLVADTQTMVTEAALLGTPAIRSNSFVGDDDMGNFVELEKRGLVRNLRSFDDVLTTAVAFASDPEIEREWAARRDEYVGGLINLTDLITAVATDTYRRGHVERPTDEFARQLGV
ncbi:hypothetical protein SAMN04487949_2261 [Halogranum gelatinilyticum]|uniref:DUF354 domain-containing protein n=1 Tax=Halogranum gelatinilyticum TaxID=660521 RepID=A0A1G9UN96_9EURY|nr:DUF354 domain-containing protein [Halogranum gelatinilyticum]SDM61369.1 hypothetical protein SAMN04487949_2261 [Halogranum gelatinilyticum]